MTPLVVKQGNKPQQENLNWFCMAFGETIAVAIYDSNSRFTIHEKSYFYSILEQNHI